MAPDEPPRRPDEPETVQFGASGGAGSHRLWLLVAVGVVVAGVIAVFVIRRGTEPPAQPAAVDATTTPPSPSAASRTTASATASATPRPTSHSTATSTGSSFVRTWRLPKTTPPHRVSVSHLNTAWLDASSDWQVFLRTTKDLLRIDVADGTVVRTAVPTLQSGGPVSFVVRRGAVLIHPNDNVPAYVVPDGQPPHRAPHSVGEGGWVYAGPKPNQVWVQGAEGYDTWQLKRLDGRPVGPTVTIPRQFEAFARPDGAGHLLVAGPGGVYVATRQGFHRVTTGEVIASGPATLLTLECDAQAHCGLVVVDRRSGDRHPVPGPWPPARVRSGVTSPDGSTAALGVYPGGDVAPTLRLLDLATGQSTDVAVHLSQFGSAADRSMAWSPDSEWLFVVAAGGNLKAVNAATGQVRAVPVAHLHVEAVAVRPARDHP